MSNLAIYINYALAELKIATEPQTIRYVRTTGQNRGSITVKKVMYGKGAPASPNRPNKHWGKIPLTDVETGITANYYIANIIGFNQYIVKH